MKRKKRRFTVPTADVYQISNVKIVFCNVKKSVFGAVFPSSCNGAYNNVHKLSIHWMAFSVNLFPLLFYHLPRIYSPFTIYTRSQIQTHKYTTNFHSSTFNAQSFFPCVCILFAFCSCLFACNFFLSALAFVFFKVVLESGDCVCLFITVPFFSRSLHFLHYVRISTSIFCLLFSAMNVLAYTRFGSHHNGTMMKMQMRWHNHSNLIHSIDFVRKFIRNKESNVVLELYCRWNSAARVLRW